MSRNSERPTVTIKEFPGLKNANDPSEVQYKGLMNALNVDITRTAKVRRRRGATRVHTSAGTITAAWGEGSDLLYTEGASLYSLDSSYNKTLIRNDLTPTDKLCAKRINTKLIYSNGIETGVIENGVDRTLGLETAPPPAVSAYNAGNMRAGTYLVAYTYQRSDGQESGCALPAVITLTEDNSGIQVTHVASSDSTVDKINIYCSAPDGTELMLAVTVDNASATTTYNAHPNFLKGLLRTQFKRPPPAFDVIDVFNGSVLYGTDKYIFYSDPFAPEQVGTNSFLPFQARVNVIGVVDSGIFIGTEEAIGFAAGSSVFDLQAYDNRASYGAVFGTRTYVDGKFLGEGEESDILPVWMSHKGICIGKNNGTVENVTSGSVDIPKGLRGTSVYREQNGQKHFVSVIQE